MTDALKTVAALRAFVAIEYEPGSLEALVAQRFRPWLEGGAANGMTLEEAFGLKPGRGQRPWYRVEQRERQNAAARRLVEECGSWNKAWDKFNKYAHGRGRTARAGHRYSDDQTQAAHEYLHATPSVPRSPRTLRRASKA